MQWHDIDTPEGRATLMIEPLVSTWVAPDGHACLSDEDRASVERFKHAKHRDFYRNVRVLVRHSLGKYLDVVPGALRLARACSQCGSTDHGKPYLPNHPEVHFNISHSGDTLVLALSATTPVGVDVEHGKVTDAELRQLKIPIQPEVACIDQWVRAEAALKALGWGLGALERSPDAYPRLLCQTRSTVLHGLLDVPIGLAWVQLKAPESPGQKDKG